MRDDEWRVCFVFTNWFWKSFEISNDNFIINDTNDVNDNIDVNDGLVDEATWSKVAIELVIRFVMQKLAAQFF